MVVIAILAILSVGVILTLNPQELIKQGRDSTRVSDLASINSALNIYQVDSPSGSMGNTSTTYISIPDPTATSTTSGNACTGIGLPSLPSGYSYHCSASSTYRNTDGTGWIPVNFTSISYSSPLGALPVDPINTSSSGNYYTYTPGGSWETTASMESAKYATNMATDGGIDPAVYETGTNLYLAKGIRGLVGYWKFDEGSGTSAGDSSGNGNTGTLTNGPTWTNGKVDAALSFNGTSQYASIPDTANLRPSSITISAWVNIASLSSAMMVFNNRAINLGVRTYNYNLYVMTDGKLHFISGTPAWSWNNVAGTTVMATGTWYHIAAVKNGATLATLYVNGVQESTTGGFATAINYQSGTPVNIGYYYIAGYEGPYYYSGLIDDVRVYNRALSAAEIAALYNATR